VKSSGDISAEPVRGQKFEEYVVTDLNLRNDENRPSLTSCAAAEKLQDVSSKNTIDELADAVTGGNGIGLWSSKLSEKMREYWLKNEKSCSTTQKRQNLVTEMHHICYSAPESQR